MPIENKIDAIKKIRQYTLDTFGITSSLLDTKNFIEISRMKQFNRPLTP